jgi:hypothetical protein
MQSCICSGRRNPPAMRNNFKEKLFTNCLRHHDFIAPLLIFGSGCIPSLCFDISGSLSTKEGNSQVDAVYQRMAELRPQRSWAKTLHWNLIHLLGEENFGRATIKQQTEHRRSSGH